MAGARREAVYQIAFKAEFAIIAHMFKIKALIFIFTAVVLTGGCSQVVEISKGVWGSSTKALEDGRATAIHKTYLCNVTECFDAVLNLTVPPKEEDLTVIPPTQDTAHLASVSPKNPSLNAIIPSSENPNNLDLFMKNRKKNLIVVMGVPNCVDTTEVGIFFTPVDEGNVKVELSSLSSKAKKIAAEMVFAELSKHFSTTE